MSSKRIVLVTKSAFCFYSHRRRANNLHTFQRYVSAIHIPSFSRGSLISGGGDPVLKVWDWMMGRLQRDIHIFEAIEPFVTVKAPKPRRKSQEDGDDGGDAEGSKGKSRRKKKGKAKQDTPSNDTEGPSKAPETETVVVVRRISSFVSDRGNHIVFSIVGYATRYSVVCGPHACLSEQQHYSRLL